MGSIGSNPIPSAKSPRNNSKTSRYEGNPMGKHPYGTPFSVSFNSTSLSTGANNLFPFQCGADTRVIIDEIHVCLQVASTIAGNPSVSLFRGSTTPVSTASLFTPVRLSGISGGIDATSICSVPSTVAPSTVSAQRLDVDGFIDGYHYEYDADCDVLLAPSQRFDVVISAVPSNTAFGTMRFREIGKNPIS